MHAGSGNRAKYRRAISGYVYDEPFAPLRPSNAPRYLSAQTAVMRSLSIADGWGQDQYARFPGIIAMISTTSLACYKAIRKTSLPLMSSIGEITPSSIFADVEA